MPHYSSEQHKKKLLSPLLVRGSSSQVETRSHATQSLREQLQGGTRTGSWCGQSPREDPEVGPTGPQQLCSLLQRKQLWAAGADTQRHSLLPLKGRVLLRKKLHTGSQNSNHTEGRRSPVRGKPLLQDDFPQALEPVTRKIKSGTKA